MTPGVSLRAAALGLLATLAAACGGGGDDDGCVQVDLDCAPLYEPVFEEVHSRTLAAKCAVAGSACHSREGAQNGLVLEGIDTAYDALLDSRVLPGDPSCSLVVRRIESDDADFAMPPGMPLGAAERCAIIRWIADGAAR